MKHVDGSECRDPSGANCKPDDTALLELCREALLMYEDDWNASRVEENDEVLRKLNKRLGM